MAEDRDIKVKSLTSKKPNLVGKLLLFKRLTRIFHQGGHIPQNSVEKNKTLCRTLSFFPSYTLSYPDLQCI